MPIDAQSAPVARLTAGALAYLKGAREIHGLSGCGFSLVVSAQASARTVLCICPGPESAYELAMDLEILLPGRQVFLTPPMGSDPAERLGAWLDFLGRLHAAEERQGEGVVVVTPVSDLCESLPAPVGIAGNMLALAPGDVLEPQKLAERLQEAGFSRVEQVDAAGEFARRGGIFDIFPPGRTHPIRIELFGDDIDSIRAFDPATQLSFDTLEGISFPLVPLTGGGDASLLEHLDAAQVVVVDHRASHERLRSLATFAEEEVHVRRVREAAELLQRADLLLYGELDGPGVELACVAPVALGEGYPGVASLVKALRESGRDCVLFCGSEAEYRLAAEGLRQEGVVEGEGVTLREGDIGGGRVLPALGFALLSLHELLGRPRRRHFVEANDAEETDHAALMDDFVQIERGDYVVHLGYGIARYRGMETLEREGTKGEFLALQFADDVMLHVPAAQADVVQKYIGLRGDAPVLSKFNTQSWSERKLRAQHAVLKLAQELLELQALRARETGHPCKQDGSEQAQFEAACPFRDTPDQARTSIDIKRDMQSPKPMDRLLCGDVGFGKTELAIRAAFKMACEGRQTAVLVPTTVLAQQHFLSFSDRMANFPVLVGVLSRMRTDAENRRTIEDLAEGRIDIVIGTHRLLSKDVQFKDLGLVVIDEEQRFGVEHKERLKKLRQTVDVLTLTATPIPRTLHQSMLGLKDISTLATPPSKRMPVLTKRVRYDDKMIREAILHELHREGQVYFVHNRVYDIQQVANRLKELAPEARIGVGHGQMNEHQLEDVMLRFMRGEIDVLVSTTIIESGIDVPTANTMFIDQAQNYGLADLHQLRGRVGRYHHQAYCYLIVPEDRRTAEIAEKRLKAILSYSALGSGFRIAMRDLEIRGAGNLLGAEQSGHIASIGYDLYCRLLERAVRKLKHQSVPPDVESSLDIGLHLEIPRGWISSQARRLEIYRKLARIASPEQAEALERETTDRFGKPPRAFSTLLMAALVRNRMARLGVVSVMRGEGHLKLRCLSASSTHRKLSLASNSFRVLDETALALPLRKGLDRPEDQLRFLSNLLQALQRHGVYGAEA